MTQYNRTIARREGTNTKLWLYALARRANAIQSAEGAPLPSARLLNRLHARGIDCNQRDLDEALALRDLDGRDAGLSLKEVAVLINVAPEVLEGWIGNPQEQGGMPTLGVVYQSPAGKVATYDYFDALLLKHWKKALEKEAE